MAQVALMRVELLAIGSVTPRAAMLVRPDGYVAWVGDGSRLELAEALAMWFGRPVGAQPESEIGSGAETAFPQLRVVGRSAIDVSPAALPCRH
jgi:hypothetical protein